MTVRFSRKVVLPGGPQYYPGETAVLPDDLAARYVSLGWVEEIHEMAEMKAPVRPPRDKQILAGWRKGMR
jgi:hypothetical protein